MDDILQEQIVYYRARADEYDQRYRCQGRYDLGPERNRQWFDELAEVRQALQRCGPVDSALELACGTGIWTQWLLEICARIHAIDAAPEMLAISRAKLQTDRVTWEQADLFAWQPQQVYDLVFCGFWLSHVPPDRLSSFLAQVARALRPGGRLFLVDSQSGPLSAYGVQDNDDFHDKRALNDGRRFTVIKVFHEPQALGASLAAQGLKPALRVSANHFIYGTADKVQAQHAHWPDTNKQDG